MTNYEIPIKCMACGLHFTLWSESPDRNAAEVFCPECGVQGSKIMWGPVEIEDFIFSKVPGSAPIGMMG